MTRSPCSGQAKNGHALPDSRSTCSRPSVSSSPEKLAVPSRNDDAASGLRFRLPSYAPCVKGSSIPVGCTASSALGRAAAGRDDARGPLRGGRRPRGGRAAVVGVGPVRGQMLEDLRRVAPAAIAGGLRLRVRPTQDVRGCAGREHRGEDEDRPDHRLMMTGSPGERRAEDAHEHRVVHADAPVRHRAPDRGRRVRPVDRDRPALRPAGEDVREGGDPDRPRPEGAVGILRDEPLVDVVAAERGWRRARADRGARREDGLAVAEERHPSLRDVDQDPRPHRADRDRPAPARSRSRRSAARGARRGTRRAGSGRRRARRGCRARSAPRSRSCARRSRYGRLPGAR